VVVLFISGSGEYYQIVLAVTSTIVVVVMERAVREKGAGFFVIRAPSLGVPSSAYLIFWHLCQLLVERTQ
jgi:hypothetical protein